jgi:hypothetical protein
MTPAGAIPDLGLTLFLPFIIQALFFIRANCPMIDEAEHLAGGCSYLAKRDLRLDPKHPPFIKELQALSLFLFYRLDFTPNPNQWFLLEENSVVEREVPR